jgi:hypothetical protein
MEQAMILDEAGDDQKQAMIMVKSMHGPDDAGDGPRAERGCSSRTVVARP